MPKCGVEQDRNGDGYVSNQEYYVSLYNKVLNPETRNLWKWSLPLSLARSLSLSPTPSLALSVFEGGATAMEML